MLKEKWMILMSVAILIIGLFMGNMLLKQTAYEEYDMIAINRIVKYVESNWSDFSSVDNEELHYDFAVIDRSENLHFQTRDNIPVTIHEAVKNHNIVMDVTNKGKVLIATNQKELILESEKHLFELILIIFMVFALLIIGYFFYLNYNVLSPYRKLKSFAMNIAAGNMDVPLEWTRIIYFGPFTESFDIMRDQLKEARRKEALANQSKKELIASLSHDIKTPVTSIKLLCELLEVTSKEEAVKENMALIYQKADQIEHLITNMFQASLEELGQLQVSVTEEESTVLYSMIQNADYYRKISKTNIPECIVRMDPLRMQQVFDNIINNSFKYANTNIDITFSLVEEFLKVKIKDYGNGVAEEELHLIFQKFYRGSNTAIQKQEGSGIGLYISHYFMEQMGGTIRCLNHPDGFETELLIPLA